LVTTVSLGFGATAGCTSVPVEPEVDGYINVKIDDESSRTRRSITT